MSTKCQQTVNKTQKRLQNPKKSAVFFCEICDYNTSHKSHYTKHLSSKKHVNKMSTKFRKTAPKKCRKVPFFFECDYCLKKYKSRQGLWAHKKKCKNITSVTELKNENINKNENNEILDIVLKNNENNNEILESSNKILETSNKILESNETDEFVTLKKDEYLQMLEQAAEAKGKAKGYKEVIDMVKNGSLGNNTNNIGTQNNITLNVFLNEHCKDALNLEDFMKNIHFKLKDILNEGNYIDNCVSVKLLNDLNEIPVTKRPIHCTDQRRKNFMVKDKEEGWIKEKVTEGSKIQKEIDKLYDKAYLEFYHAYDEKHPFPHNTIEEDLKQRTSHNIIQKKDKHKIVGTVARSVDIKEAMEKISKKK
ncbi:MAG: hypothetical protein CBB97_24115 [Candidatus Endolissoclinum sp. TMED37]|nr:MAG: hypothetical protein CBB97_24115 [Candidatus Endolissoclinum sp. TMED37]